MLLAIEYNCFCRGKVHCRQRTCVPGDRKVILNNLKFEYNAPRGAANMERIGGETLVLYIELRDRLETLEAMRCIASLSGEFTTKIVKGRMYHYFQATLPGGRTQIYLGPDNAEVRRLIAEHGAGRRDFELDRQLVERLAAQIAAGGVAPVAPDMSRVIKRLADSAVFRVGGVLVGSVAFHVIGIHLGVHWDARLRTTQDVDLPTGSRVPVVVPDSRADVPRAIESLRMGFFPVPRLSHKEPSTSYAIRGKTLRIDLLTPARRGKTSPVFISRLNAAAQPLKYLDYLFENPLPAAMVSGNPCLVNVPRPARFALHKLLTSQERSAVSAGKKSKDVAQARALLELLKEDRPGDIHQAREDLERRGKSWSARLRRALKENGLGL